MQRSAFLLSLGLHAVVISLMFADFHFTKEYTKAPPAVLMVDLTKVKIADKTNLPQKTVPKKEQPKAEPKKEEPKPTPKVEKSKPKPEVKQPEPKPEPKPAPVPKDAVAVQPPKQEQKKETAKPAPKPKPKKPDYNLKSLLASVEKVRQDAPAPKTKDESEDTSNAMDNGTEGRMDKILSISHRDLIASKLRDCWNIDGGAQDIEEIVVEIRVLVNKDGSIREAKIMNNMNLPAFRSLSESARRAVHICAQKGDDSPFKILADNYADHYNDWKELYLNFNPMDANVF